MNQRVTIHYTTKDIPAPYSFAIRAELTPGQEISVKFNLTYTDREELDEDEIADEGFTGNDDISWEGTLPQIWGASLEELISKSSWAAKANKKAHCIVKIRIGDSAEQIPAQPDMWEYWLQELQQACMEAAKIERGLEMDWVQGRRKISLKASFVARQASTELRTVEGTKEKNIQWTSLRKLLKHIYIAEYLPEYVLTNYDDQGDTFLNPGGGQWFNLNKANLHLDKKTEWINKLETMINELVNDPSS